MIEVLRGSTKQQVECGACGALLQYDREDVKIIQTGMNETDRVIQCPCCKSNISVRGY